MTKISFGVALEDSFNAMKKNFRSFFWTYLLFQVVLLVLMIPFFYLTITGATVDAVWYAIMIPAILLILIITIYFNMLIGGMTLHAVENKKVSAQIGMEYGKKYFWKYCGIFLLMLLAMLILAVPFVLALVLAFGSDAYISTSPALGIIGLILGSLIALALLILIICFVAAMIFLPPKTIVEDKGAYATIKDAIAHLKREPGYVWAVAGIVFAIAFCTSIIGLLFDLPFTLSGITLANLQFQSGTTITIFILANIIKTVIQVVIAIYMNMFITKAYVAGHKNELEAFRGFK